MELPILLTAVTIVLLLILSVPIAAALGLGVMVGMIAGDLPPEFMMQKVFSSLDSFPLLAVPFFILAGEIMQKGSMADALLRVSRCLVGHITGGMAHVSILTCMFYGALSGSSPATVAAVGGIMIPAMEKEGYPRDFSAAVNTSAGCLGVMIPPSVPLIIYGTTVGVSVSDLFIAGILPGIFVGVVLMFTAWALVRRRGINVATRKATRRETLRAVWEAKHALLVPVIVLGGIYGGIFTPTEAGAVAVLYAFVVESLLLRSLTWSKTWEVLKGAAITNATIFIIMCVALRPGAAVADLQRTRRRQRPAGRRGSQQISAAGCDHCHHAHRGHVHGSPGKHHHPGAADVPGDQERGHRPGAFRHCADNLGGPGFSDPPGGREPFRGLRHQQDEH